MSHKHEQLLRTIFHDPISANIHWREIESLLNHVGAQIEPLVTATSPEFFRSAIAEEAFRPA